MDRDRASHRPGSLQVNSTQFFSPFLCSSFFFFFNKAPSGKVGGEMPCASHFLLCGHFPGHPNTEPPPSCRRGGSRPLASIQREQTEGAYCTARGTGGRQGGASSRSDTRALMRAPQISPCLKQTCSAGGRPPGRY